MRGNVTRRRLRGLPCAVVALRSVRRPHRLSSAPLLNVCGAAAQPSEAQHCWSPLISRPGALPSQLAALPRACVDWGGRGRDRRAANGSVGVGGRGHERQLGAGKSRGAEATQRQYTGANDDRDGRSDRSDHAGAPASIAEGAEATNTPRRRGILQTATPARSNKVGASSGCAATTHGSGRWRG